VLAANLPAPQLKALYQEALTAGHVFPQFIAAWSRALTEEGPDYLPHLLGHIAYAYSPACDYDKPGAYVKEMAAERLPAPAEFLPPAGLNFAGALAWALRGGRAEELPAPAASKPDPASEPAMPDPALDAPWEGCAQSPRQIWQTACRQLQLELNKSVYDTWVRSVAALPPEDGVFVLGVSHTYAKDWLENRLLETLKRVVSGVVGRGVEVRLALLKEVCL
jgi:hypothetical protein